MIGARRYFCEMSLESNRPELGEPVACYRSSGLYSEGTWKALEDSERMKSVAGETRGPGLCHMHPRLAVTGREPKGVLNAP